MQVLALLERIKRQDAGEIEPPAIAIGGFRGNGGDFADDEDEDGDDIEVEDDLEVCCSLFLHHVPHTSTVCLIIIAWARIVYCPEPGARVHVVLIQCTQQWRTCIHACHLLKLKS